MASVRIGGSARDLERFSHAVAGPAAVEVLGPFERRVRWAVGDRSGVTSSTALDAGVELTTSAVAWERSWALAVDHAVSPLKFVLMRGPGPRLTTSDGQSHDLGGAAFSLGQVKRPVRLRFAFADRSAGARHEQVSLAIAPDRLRALLGVEVLPEAVTRVLAREGAYPTGTWSMTPGLMRLFDEIVHCDARGASRRLHLEARGLGLLAALLDAIDEEARAASPRLSACDRDRLERARQLLIARLDDPPSLRDLARSAGLNEVKLKAGFRALFGSTVYGYLREHRMDTARRLLLARRHSVTEVAGRVGYANPSKFAAAFRRKFGVCPSDLA